MTNNLSEAQLDLARELVDDVELSRLPAEQILLKALRLGRLQEDDRAQEWLRYELRGYPNTEKGKGWMKYFGRFTDENASKGYWIPLAGISGTISSFQTQIQTLRIPDVHFAPSSANPSEYVAGYGGTSAHTMVQPANNVLIRLQQLTDAMSTLSSIRSRVLASIHEFAVASFHRLAFSGLAESIFEKHRKAIDVLMRAVAPDALEKIPSLYDRLSADDPEAVSQAMNSLRRIFKAVADRVYPASNEPVIVDGHKYEVGSDKVLNRIKLFLLVNCPSESRRDRLSRSMRDIHERASAGAHTDIGSREAQSLFLAAYLAVGEVLEFASVSTEVETAQPGHSDEARERAADG